MENVNMVSIPIIEYDELRAIKRAQIENEATIILQVWGDDVFVYSADECVDLLARELKKTSYNLGKADTKTRELEIKLKKAMDMLPYRKIRKLEE